MKIISSIYTNSQLNKLNGYIDYAMLMVEDYSLIYENLDLDLALSYCKGNNIKPIIAINKLVNSSELNKVISFIDKYKNDDVLFYLSDIGIAYYFVKCNLADKVILDLQTMIANYKDLNEYNQLGLNALALSEEITLSDIIKAYDLTKADLFMMVFGTRLMFYSKRSLISLYEQKNNDSYPKNNTYLKEVTRNDYFPIVENNNGTLIYRSYVLSYLDKLNDLSFLKYAYFDSFNLDFDKYTELLIELKNNPNNASNKAVELGFNIQDGFKYKDSVYQKEELKQ